MERYICIHGHFYQPPRENPWLEAVELQDSAYPFHDWNERVAAECYAANAASRILGPEGKIVRITNNYSRISFNVGPTLLSWMKDQAPDAYKLILAADKESQELFSGHGSAMAQAYNHMIMPLANAEDKHTQVIWGIADFEHRFGRRPEGMWLPETAVDLETLDIMAGEGILFTTLSPYQASRTRPIGGSEDDWVDASGGKIDPTRAYRVNLPSGRSIAVFFYDGPISRAVAFEKLLSRGEVYAERLMGAFSDERDWPQLVHIATDGETYGHHHRKGDMALAYALQYIEARGVKITNYGEFLEKHPPTQEAEIFESTAWSCVHGVGRWKENCGCNTGRDGWNQEWRGPLRAALDWLRDTISPMYERYASTCLRDPWAARNDYIHVILDRSEANVAGFFERNCHRYPSQDEMVRLIELLEMQRHAMLMYTSCGWFFDDLSGIETTQVIAYAGRVIQLAEFVFSHEADDLEEEFLQRMELAKSNIPENENGRVIYQKLVKPGMIELLHVGAHFAISSIFESYGPEPRIFCYQVNVKDYQNFEAGRARLIVGYGEIVSMITGYRRTLTFGAVHWGDHNLNAGVRDYRGKQAYATMVGEVSDAFSRADFPELIRALDRNFDKSNYSLRNLFRDEQRKILNYILESSVMEAEQAYRHVYENHAPLLRFLADLGMPAPSAFSVAGEFVYNRILREALESPDIDINRARTYLRQSRQQKIKVDGEGLGHAFKQTLEGLMDALYNDPEAVGASYRLRLAASLLVELPFSVDLWKAQNRLFDIMRDVYPQFAERASEDSLAQDWLENLHAVAEAIHIDIPDPAQTQEQQAGGGEGPS